MTWQSPHPLALRIDPNEGRPALAGSRWERREKVGDNWDQVVCVGVFDLGNDSGGIELCIQSEIFGEPVMTANPDGFASAYRRIEADDDDPVERLTQRLQALEAAVA